MKDKPRKHQSLANISLRKAFSFKLPIETHSFQKLTNRYYASRLRNSFISPSTSRPMRTSERVIIYPPKDADLSTAKSGKQGSGGEQHHELFILQLRSKTRAKRTPGHTYLTREAP